MTHPAFSGNGSGQLGLADSGRPDQKNTLWNLRPDFLKLLRVLEVADDVLDLLLVLVDAWLPPPMMSLNLVDVFWILMSLFLKW